MSELRPPARRRSAKPLFSQRGRLRSTTPLGRGKHVGRTRARQPDEISPPWQRRRSADDPAAGTPDGAGAGWGLACSIFWVTAKATAAATRPGAGSEVSLATGTGGGGAGVAWARSVQGHANGECTWLSTSRDSIKLPSLIQKCNSYVISLELKPNSSTTGSGLAITLGWLLAAPCSRCVTSSMPISEPSLTSMHARTRSSDKVRLVTLSCSNWLLGTMISWLARVRILVLRAPIRSIVPRMPSISTMSPTRIGCSASRIKPLMKLFSTFWLPKPMPMAAAPPRNVNVASGRPASCNASKLNRRAKDVKRHRLDRHHRSRIQPKTPQHVPPKLAARQPGQHQAQQQIENAFDDASRVTGWPSVVTVSG